MIFRCWKRKRFHELDKVLLLLALLQVGLWEATFRIHPEMETVPRVPSVAMAKLFSFGDDQLYFRSHVLELQTAGITFGRAIRLEDFDYVRIYYWMKLLDKFDFRSSTLPYMASFWFSRTQNNQDVRYMVDYLMEYVRGRIDSQWRWQTEALNLANYKLSDQDLAMRIALPLQNVRSAPLIVRELPAFIHEQRGETDAARKVMEEIKADTTLPQNELNFMNYFLTERLNHQDGGVRYFKGRNAIVKAVSAPAVPMSNPDERQFYTANEIRSKVLLGVRLGMVDTKALRILAKDQWSGKLQPFSDPGVAETFEKNGNKLWIYRVKGKDRLARIWMVVYTEFLNNAPDLHVLTDIVTRQYGVPSQMNIHEQRSAYVYYYTPLKLEYVIAPQLEVEVGSSTLSFQLKDETMLSDVDLSRLGLRRKNP